MKQLSKICIALSLIFATSNTYAFPGKKAKLLVLAACSLASGSQAAPIHPHCHCDTRFRLENSCSDGMIPVPIDCVNCNFERGNLDGWVFNGNAGVSSNYRGIMAQSGNYLAYIEAGEKDVWQYLKRMFEHLPIGTTISGFVGFYDAENKPMSDQGELVDKDIVDLQPYDNIVKSWASVEKPKISFRGWEHFEFRARGNRELVVRVKNVGDSSLNSSIVIDNVSLCAPVCNETGPGKWQVCACEAHGPCNNECYDWKNVTNRIHSYNYLATNFRESYLGVCRD